jgi:phage shock protein B
MHIGSLVPLGIVFLTVVAPMWIVFHYGTQSRKARRLSSDYERALGEMWQSARRMEGRIEALGEQASARPVWLAPGEKAFSGERVERRLAAILASDIAGYSRLMEVDEEGTLRDHKMHRAALVDPKISEHRGRIVKTTGDGALVEFQSVLDAVRCAVEVQRAMAERNAGVPADKRIEFRIGIHQGDIIVDAGDIFGDGVNLAARLEALAEPGGICVSRVVRDEVRDKLDVAFDDLGEQQVKNISRPLRAFAVRVAGEVVKAPAERPPLPLPDKPSLAVLQFPNATGHAEQDYVAARTENRQRDWGGRWR